MARTAEVAVGRRYNRGADDDEVLSVDTTPRLWDLRVVGRNIGAGLTTPSVWSTDAPSPADNDAMPHGMQQLPPGDPVLSLQLTEDRVLTRTEEALDSAIWDLDSLDAPSPACASAAERRQSFCERSGANCDAVIVVCDLAPYCPIIITFFIYRNPTHSHPRPLSTHSQT